MSLEQTVVDAYNFIAYRTLDATLDIGGHLLTGALLAQRYFPEAPISKKMALSFYSGLMPDFDLFTFGAIPHRTATHTGWFLGTMTFNTMYGVSELDYNVRNASSLTDKVRYALTSRWTKITAAGIGAHLFLDYPINGNHTYMSVYCASVVAALIAQTVYNFRHKSNIVADQEHKTKQGILPCVVVDKDENHYYVNEFTQAHCENEDYTSLPRCIVPEYVYYSNDSRELVRQYQHEHFAPPKTIWEKIDGFVSSGLIKAKEIFSNHIRTIKHK